ncbi:unnamed protein product [Calypogeia fissa]
MDWNGLVHSKLLIQLVPVINSAIEIYSIQCDPIIQTQVNQRNFDRYNLKSCCSAVVKSLGRLYFKLAEHNKNLASDNLPLKGNGSSKGNCCGWLG